MLCGVLCEHAHPRVVRGGVGRDAVLVDASGRLKIADFGLACEASIIWVISGSFLDCRAIFKGNLGLCFFSDIP